MRKLVLALLLLGCEETVVMVPKAELVKCQNLISEASASAAWWERRYNSERDHSTWLEKQLMKPRPCRQVYCSRIVKTEGREDQILTWEPKDGHSCDGGPR